MRDKAGNADAISRKDFLRGGLASLGFLALPGGLFAAPSDWKPKKKPNLAFGVPRHRCSSVQLPRHARQADHNDMESLRL